MAIIDILTHYDAKKKAAHAAKTVKHGVSTDSCTPCPACLAPQRPGAACRLSWLDTSSPFWLAVLSSLVISLSPGVRRQHNPAAPALIALCVCGFFHVWKTRQR